MKKNSIILKKIGKNRIYINQDHKLPEYRKNFPFYDRALPRICQEINKIDEFLTVIDIGANIGDSVSLISEKTKGSFLCVEGESKYISILKKNIPKFNNSYVEIEASYCSEPQKSNKSLSIEVKNGTAKIVTNNDNLKKPLTNIKTLDQIISEHPKFKNPNILKIDTDGFEINVIRGATNFLKSVRPVIFFEFTPALYQNLNQNPLEILSTLFSLGYTFGLFYDNFGQPTEIVEFNDIEKINKLINKIDDKNIYYYDILVYHQTKKQYEQLFTKELLNHAILTSKYINKLNNNLESQKQDSSLLNERLESTQEKLKSTEEQLDSSNSQLQQSVDKLHEIYKSQGWRFLKYLYSIRDLALKILGKL